MKSLLLLSEDKLPETDMYVFCFYQICAMTVVTLVTVIVTAMPVTVTAIAVTQMKVNV